MSTPVVRSQQNKSGARKKLLLAALLLVSLIAAVALSRRSDVPAQKPAETVANDHAVVPSTPSEHPAITESRKCECPTETVPAVAAAPRISTGEPLCDLFADWIQTYSTAPAAARPALLSLGRVLAEQRFERMKSIIENDPQRALALALPYASRRQLPAEFGELLEVQVSGVGDLDTIVARNEDGAVRSTQRRIASVNGALYEARTFGRRADQKKGRKLSIHGVAIGAQLAIQESPVRVLSTMEAADLGLLKDAATQSCPVSGELAISKNDLQIALVGGRSVYLCSGGHIHSLDEEAIAQEGGTGGGQEPNGAVPTTWTTGVKSLLYIRVVFPDIGTDPASEATVNNTINATNSFFVENSHGAYALVGTVTPPIVMPKTAAWYIAQSGGDITLLSHARTAAQAAGFDYTAYDLEAIRYTGGPGGFAGQAYVGGRGCWMKSDSAGVAAHEFGHNLGLWHANFWDANPDTTVIGTGSHVEYGHSFDTMGAASAGNNFFNTQHKSTINWLPPAYITTVAASGTYRVVQHDQPVLANGSRYALKIQKDNIRHYWGEFRQRFTGNAWMMSGLLLHWSPWFQSAGGAHLLDTTPGTPTGNGGKDDAAIVIGRTFSDVEAGIHITPIAKGGTTPESIDVVVNLGQFPGNTAPTVGAIGASATSVATGVAVNFSITASDPNGDPLAYYWEYGDLSFGTNSATVSKSWATAGKYNVTCTVSDMKGKTVTRSILITVGAPTTFSISGQVTDGATPIAGARIAAVNGGTTAYTFTDSNGNYTVTNRAAGTWTLTAISPSYTFASTPTATVGPDAANINISGTAKPKVNFTIVDGTMAEPSDTGTVRINRTGPTTAAQTVKFLINGSASYTGDYTVSPTPTLASSIYSVSIPAGAAFVDLVCTPVADTTQESVEAFQFILYPDTTYESVGSGIANMTIADDDTPKPKISIAATDFEAGETGGNTATFTITRTGATTAALNVDVTISGTATAGTDYASLTLPVTIGAGSSTGTLTITPTNDALAEGTETVIASITSNTNYIIDFSFSTATAFILDDDIPALTLSANDPTASETGPDTGSFQIVRTGSTASDLTVPYAIAGTALHGTDYKILPGVVTIPAGSTTASIIIEPFDDAAGEPAQTVILSLRSSLAWNIGTPSTGTVTITDNDVPYIQVITTDANAVEAATPDNATFSIVRTQTGTAITVNYTIGGTALSGTDYTALTGSVSFAAGDTSKTVTITPVDDTDIEDTETVVLTLTPSATYTIADSPSCTVYINDNDSNRVNVSAGDEFASESGANTGQFFLARPSGTGALTVSYVMSGTAVNGTDYALLPGTISFADGQVNATVTFTPVDDALVEGTETVTLTVVAGAGYGAGVSPSATIYLTDSESPTTTVQFASATGSGAEGTASVNMSVTLSAAAASNVTVEYKLSGGTAANGADYTFTNGLLTFTPGQTSKTIPLTVLNDPFVESNETVRVQLYNPYNARFGTNTTHTYTINDNDGSSNTPPTISNIADLAINEDTATSALPFTVGDAETAAGSLVLSAGSSNTTLVPVANITFGGSGANRTVTVTPAANMSGSATITVNVSDGAVSVSDTFVLTVNPVNDAPTISNIADRSTNEDTSTGAVAFTVGDLETAVGSLTLTGGSSNTTLVPVANITFGGSGASRTVTVVPAANQNGTATITVTVSDGTTTANDTFALTVTAINDAPTISNIADRSTNEDTSTGAVAFTVGDLETAVGSLTLTGGSSNTTLVPVANITFGGSGASRTVTVVPAANQSGTATITVTVSDGTTTASDTFVLTVTAQNDTPTITDITNKGTLIGVASGPHAFTIGDVETAAASLTVTRNSSNTTLVPVANVVLGGSGASRTVTVTPAPGLTGTSTITITVSDGVASASDTFLVTVSPANSAPVVNAGTDAGVTLPASAALDATVNDDGLPSSPGVTTVTWSKQSGPGTVTFGNANVVDTSASFSVAGTYTLRLTANDGALSAFDDVVITVAPANNPPTAGDGTLATTKNTAKSSALTGADADGQPITFAIVANGTIGTAVITDSSTGAFTYTPNPKKSGTDTFTFKTSDGSADSNVATITVTIANAKPTAGGGAVNTTVAEPVGGPLTAADADNDDLMYEVVSQGTMGTVAVDPATGAFVYTPDAGAVGTDTFTFRVFDGDEFSDLATVTVTVNGTLVINSVPTATPNPAVAGETVQFTITASGSGALTYAWDFGDGSAGSGAAVSHAYAVAGSYPVSVTVSEAAGQSASGTLTITVTENGGGGGGGGSGPERVAMTVSKLSGSMNFAASGKDSVSVSGLIPNLPKGFNAAGLPAVLDIGGATTSFTLDAKGAAKSATGTFALKLKPAKKNPATKKSEFVGGSAAFKAKLSKGSWSAAWADEGVNPAANATKQSMSMVAELQFNGKIYAATVTVLYSAKAGKSGKFKK